MIRITIEGSSREETSLLAQELSSHLVDLGTRCLVDTSGFKDHGSFKRALHSFLNPEVQVTFIEEVRREPSTQKSVPSYDDRAQVREEGNERSDSDIALWPFNQE